MHSECILSPRCNGDGRFLLSERIHSTFFHSQLSTMPHIRLQRPLLLAVLIAARAASAGAQSTPRNYSLELPDAQLLAIRDGFDTRVAELFDAQQAIPLASIRASGWNSAQRFAYPRIEYATVNLWRGQHIESANTALVEYGEYFVTRPERVLHRDHFHWHSEMALRLIDLFGRDGTRTPGLVKPATERVVLEAVWLYCKRMQRDQRPVHTKSEADTEESATWYIYESENHHAQSLTTQWHFAKLAKDRPRFRDRTYDDGKTASQHYAKWSWRHTPVFVLYARLHHGDRHVGGQG